MWQPVKGTDKGKGKNKGANNMGKGKNPVAVCYRCSQPGHLAKDCNTAVYNLSDTTHEQQQDNTAQWYYPEQTPQLPLTAPQHPISAGTTGTSNTSRGSTEQPNANDMNGINT